MVTQKYNQQGMSAILFAMIFTIILSLLAVGFASLVRNDQRQTVDQSLGYQAQYAAETAVNQVVANLYTNPTNPGCRSYSLVSNSGVEISCVTWDNKAKNIILEQVSTEPTTAHIEVPGGYDNLFISWTAANTGTYGSGTFPNTIVANNYPVLKASFLPANTVNAVSMYFTPVNNGAGTVNNYALANGTASAADCDNATNSCTMSIAVSAATFQDGYLALSAIGQVASKITIEARRGNTPQDILNSQYVIDATAIAQDVTKRVQARVPYGSQTWRPAFAASADRMCKDIKIDGTNNTSVSGAAVCP